jgi:hypothetical protein
MAVPPSRYRDRATPEAIRENGGTPMPSTTTVRLNAAAAGVRCRPPTGPERQDLHGSRVRRHHASHQEHQTEASQRDADQDRNAGVGEQARHPYASAPRRVRTEEQTANTFTCVRSHTGWGS